MNGTVGKALVIVLDGLGDRPIPGLQGRTPLEAARTPWLDGMVERGRCGLVDPVGPGVRVGTHVGVGVLMGLSADEALSLGRGPVEAAGVGLALEAGDVALRANLATVYENSGELYVSDRRAGRIREGGGELLAGLQDIELGDGVRASVVPATQHRAVLRLCGANLSAAIGNTDPGDAVPLPARVNPCRPSIPGNSNATRTARAVNKLVRFAHRHLKDHPLNRERVARGERPASGLITRNPGSHRSLRNGILERGLTAAVVCGESTVIGLARLCGFSVVSDARFTAMTDTDLDAKLQAARTALRDHDLVYLHIKGTDICAHDREPAAKRDFLERIDLALAALPEDEAAIVVTADHTTDSNTGAHTGDPVPSLIYVPGGERDGCTHFGESDCASGGLGRLTSASLLATLLETVGAARDSESG